MGRYLEFTDFNGYFIKKIKQKYILFKVDKTGKLFNKLYLNYR